MSKSKRVKEKREEEADKVPHAGDAEYGFVVLKHKDGNHTVQPLKEEQGVKKPPTMDDIYSACVIVQKNIDTNRTAAAVHGAMSAVAQEIEQQKKTGIVVPGK